ncbi:nuclear transport factor 2 family protein [Ensifer adhaerens]|uniref:nuclear transport factor 2 family protein n=1 Tax=Ensifer adhaerens TaxID=106592 RepID=UPI00098FADD5|nr:nuclear transport factor 2 family protein [Ensifer adhaerens]
MASVKERSATRWQLALALGFSAGLAVVGPAEAQTPTCTYTYSFDYLRTVTNPPPSDRQEIMDLLHRYNWALDDANNQGMEAMLTDDVSYELCDAGTIQLQKKTGKVQLVEYLDAINGEMGDKSRRRHIESNTLLNAIDADTVEGKSTVVVTIQFTGIETPVLDYTATMVTKFKRDAGVWKFAMIVLLPDGPKVILRAR